MASVGPFLLLLLICSSFLLSSQQRPPTLNKNDVKDAAKTTLDILIKIKPLLSLIPVAGPYLSAIIETAKNVKEKDKVLSTLNSEFKKLNHKLDEQLITMTWHSWASGPFQEVELDIRLGWKNLNQLVESCEGSCKKQQFEDLFNKLHTSLVFAPDKLHMLLSSQQPSFIVNFKTLLTDQFRCHESSIEDFAQLIAGLMYQGNTVSLVYYSLHGVNKADEIAQMMFESFSVMANIHKHCIENPDEHVKKDVFDLIDENQDRQLLAKGVENFLSKTYDRYDWLVVAFLTKNSNHNHRYSRFLNRHLLSGFMEVTKGEVSVAVAKQVKGNHELAKDVSAAVDRCIGSTVECEDVIGKLEKCKGRDGKEGTLSNDYTAVHVFRDESHDSEEEVIFTAEGEDSPSAYIYTRSCVDTFKKKNFRVLIKSDEELKGGDLCKDVNCGKEGKCVQLVNIPKVICECKTGFYGSNCGISLEDLKEALRAGTIKFSDLSGNQRKS